MTLRDLPADEWHRLPDEAFPDGLPDPATSVILVVEEDGVIVGLTTLVQVVHAGHASWIAPEHRGGLVLGKLWAGVRQVLDGYRIDQAYSFADSPEVASYLSRLGFTLLPYATFLCHLPSSPPPPLVEPT